MHEMPNDVDYMVYHAAVYTKFVRKPLTSFFPFFVNGYPFGYFSLLTKSRAAIWKIIIIILLARLP
jgi:hypothetical protein